MQEAERLTQQALRVAEGQPSWREVFRKETQVTDKLLEVCDKERCVIYLQPVAKACSTKPEGRCIVQPVAFQPQSATLNI